MYSILFLICILLVNQSSAGWSSGNSGNFEDPSKWVGSAVPSGTTACEIVSDGTYTVTVTSSRSLGSSLTLGGSGNPTLLISSGVTFEVLELNLASGSVSIATGGTLVAGNVIVTSNTGNITVVYGGNARLSGIQVNSGSLQIVGQGNLDLSGAAVSVNSASSSLMLGTFTTSLSETSSFTTVALPVMVLGELTVASSVVLNGDYSFGLGSKITVADGATATFNGKMEINPTAGNTVIISGNVITNNNVTIVAGSITFTSGSFAVNTFLVMNAETLINAGTITLGSAGVIYAVAGTPIVNANINIVGMSAFFIAESGAALLLVSNTVTITQGILTVQGAIVSNGLISTTGAARIIVFAQGHTLTFNPSGMLSLGGSSMSQVSGAGYLIFLPGSTLQVAATTSIACPTIIQSAVSVYPDVALTFASPLSLLNSSSFSTAQGGNNGYIYLGPTVDILNNGDVDIANQLSIGSVHVVVPASTVVYFAAGTINMMANGYLWINGTFYTTMNDNAAILGDGFVVVNANAAWWVQRMTRISANLINFGLININSGWLIVSGTGSCEGRMTVNGRLEITGNYIMNCRASGNGTIMYNAASPMTHVLNFANFTVGSFIIGGQSTVRTEAGIYVRGDLGIKNSGAFIVVGTTRVQGYCNVHDNAVLAIRGTETLYCTGINFESSTTRFEVDVSAAGNSKVAVTGQAQFAGSLYINVDGSIIGDGAVIATYGSYEDRFTSVASSSRSYGVRYEGQRAVLTNETTIEQPVSSGSSGNSGSSDNGSSGNGSSGNVDGAEGNNAVIKSLSFVVLLLALIL